VNINNPTTFGTPSLTLSTSNSSGTGGALRADDTILVFDTSNPASVGTSPSVGSASVTSRRDHVHAQAALAAPALTLGTANSAGAATTMFATNSTILAFDAVSPVDIAVASSVGSASVVSRRDHAHEGWEQGIFTPVISHSATAAGSPAYSTQVGRYTKIGNRVYINGTLTTTGITGLTTGSAAYILGLPFSSVNVSAGVASGVIGESYGLAITAGDTVTVKNNPGTNYLRMMIWTATTGASASLTIAMWSADGSASFAGSYEVA
jgi:hypothetical protein